MTTLTFPDRSEDGLNAHALPGTVTITADAVTVEGWTFTEMTMIEGRATALRWASERLRETPEGGTE